MTRVLKLARRVEQIKMFQQLYNLVNAAICNTNDLHLLLESLSIAYDQQFPTEVIDARWHRLAELMVTTQKTIHLLNNLVARNMEHIDVSPEGQNRPLRS